MAGFNFLVRLGFVNQGLHSKTLDLNFSNGRIGWFFNRTGQMVFNWTDSNLRFWILGFVFLGFGLVFIRIWSMFQRIGNFGLGLSG